MPITQHAVIAVAGLGSRLGLGKPKSLVEVAGRTILDYQLELLRDVPDVRLVVGYLEQEVISHAFSIRRDLTIVRNPAYRTTTTQHSYWLGSRYLSEPCIYLDGDIIFEPNSFNNFLSIAAGRHPLIAVTAAKTDQAVFAEVDRNCQEPFFRTLAFSREVQTPWEWANLACLSPEMLQEDGGSVFSRLERFLPLSSLPVVCFEIDTAADLARAEAYLALPGRKRAA